MSTLVFDVEAIVDETLPPFEAKDGKDTFPPPPYWQVESIAVAVLDRDCIVQKLALVAEHGTEPERLHAFVSGWSKGRSLPRLCSWNGRGYDCPVITARCMRWGIPVPAYYQSRDVRYRFSADGHIDLMDYLSDYGSARKWQMDLAARCIGWPGKIGTSGGDVARLVREGKRRELGTYNLCDVAQETAVLLRAEVLRGFLSPDGFARAACSLLDRMQDEPRLHELLALVDKDRFHNLWTPAPAAPAEAAE